MIEPTIIDNATVYIGDALSCLRGISNDSIQCCVTSPPYYGLRDYGVDGQIGLEHIPGEYIKKLITIFREVKRVLRKDGTLWINIGDSYAGYHGNKNANYENAPSNKSGYFENMRISIANMDGLKPKDLIGIPWMLAFSLRDDGWYLRSDIIWHKLNPMPESVKDRPTKSHEYIFLLSKSRKYYYDAKAIKEPSKRPGEIMSLGGLKGRSYMPGKNDPNFRNGNEQWGRNIKTSDTCNKRSIWSIPTQSYPGSHFAVYPPALIEPCILAGSKPGDTILDPFFGSGTTGEVALKYSRKVVGIELNPEYKRLWMARIKATQRQLLISNENDNHASI